MSAHRLTRETGLLLDETTIREPKTGVDVPCEIREHAGAGRVRWALLDRSYRIVGADFPPAKKDK